MKSIKIIALAALLAAAGAALSGCGEAAAGKALCLARINSAEIGAVRMQSFATLDRKAYLGLITRWAKTQNGMREMPDANISDFLEKQYLADLPADATFHAAQVKSQRGLTTHACVIAKAPGSGQQDCQCQAIP
ncbi:MAG: hypothetical protein JWP35_4031 [Caulobacter sp.]|nr:hypothetical protein [Caulobacter sp.]